MPSQKFEFAKLWDWLAYSERTRRKVFTCYKKQPVAANWWGDISNVMLLWFRTNPINLTWIVRVTIKANFRRICMESWKHNVAYISPLSFGKRAFLSLFLSDHLTQSHNFIHLVFVTSSLLHSVEIQMRPFKPSFVYHQSAKPRKSKLYLIRMSKNVVEQILHVDINNKTPKLIRWHPLLEPAERSPI